MGNYELEKVSTKIKEESMKKVVWVVAVLFVVGMGYWALEAHSRFDPSGTYLIYFRPRQVVFKCDDGSRTISTMNIGYRFTVGKHGNVVNGYRVDMRKSVDNYMDVTSPLKCTHEKCSGTVRFVQGTKGFIMKEDNYIVIGNGRTVYSSAAPKGALDLKKVAYVSIDGFIGDTSDGRCIGSANMVSTAPTESEKASFVAAFKDFRTDSNK